MLPLSGPRLSVIRSLLSKPGFDITYQLIDALAKTSVTGNLYSWAMDNDLPGSLIERPWLAWLQGRTSAANDRIVEIRLDGKDRGAWLSVMASPTARISEYLLFDPENLRILERIILDDRGKRLAIIEYPRWQQIDGCWQEQPRTPIQNQESARLNQVATGVPATVD